MNTIKHHVLDMSYSIYLCRKIIQKLRLEKMIKGKNNMANSNKEKKKEDEEMQVANEFYDARKEYPKEMTTASESNKGK